MSVEAAPSCVAIGCSAGGFEALRELLPALGPRAAFGLAIAQHVREGPPGPRLEGLQRASPWPVSEAEDKAGIGAGRVLIAPAGYHLLIERDRSCALSADAPIRFARPSIDLFFETAAAAFGAELLGIALSGANEDGAAGLARVRRLGGRVFAQDPDEAPWPELPAAAVAQAGARPRSLAEIRDMLADWTREGGYGDR